MDDNFWQMVAGLIFRRILTITGTFLLAHGLLGTSVDQFVGAGMVFGGVGLSVWQKYGHALVEAERDRLAKNWNDYVVRKKPPAPSVQVKQ